MTAQIKLACTVACVLCDNYCPPDRLPRRGGCRNCHVGKLIKMIKEAADNG